MDPGQAPQPPWPSNPPPPPQPPSYNPPVQPQLRECRACRTSQVDAGPAQLHSGRREPSVVRDPGLSLSPSLAHQEILNTIPAHQVIWNTLEPENLGPLETLRILTKGQ